MNKSTCPPPFEEYNIFAPLEVQISSPSHFEESVKRFHSMVNKSKVLSLFKDKQSYEKPSEKKRRKKREQLQKARLLKFKDPMNELDDYK